MATMKIGGRPATEVAGGPKIEDLLSVNGSLNVNMTSLLAGENQTLNGIAVYAAGSEYVAGSATGSDITLGSVGAAGDLLEEVVIRNTDGAGTATIVIKDSTTTLDAYTTTVAASGNTRIAVGLLSVNGAWKLNITISAGTVGNIKYLACGVFS